MTVLEVGDKPLDIVLPVEEILGVKLCCKPYSVMVLALDKR